MATILQYWPEMGESKPEADGEIDRAYGSNNYFLDTPKELGKARCIRFIKRFEAKDLSPTQQYRVGWYRYRLTPAALDALDMTVSKAVLLD